MLSRTTLLLLVSIPLGSAAAAQAVESFALSGAPRVDGLFIAPDGTLFGAGTFRGSDVYRFDAEGGHETVASGLAGPTDLGIDAEGNLYVTNFNGASVSRISPDGSVTLHARVPAGPAGIVVEEDGTLFLTHYGTGNGTGRSVSRVSSDGSVEEFASGSGLVAPLGLCRGPGGDLFAANFFDGKVFRIDGEGEVTLFAKIQLPDGRPAQIGHISPGNGGLIATTGPANRLYFLDAEGGVEVLAGDGTAGSRDGPCAQATFLHPNGIAEAPDGTVFVATAGNGPGNRSTLRKLVFPPPAQKELPRRSVDPGGG